MSRKDHIESALYSFATAFLLVVLPQLGELSIEEIQGGALMGILFAGLRGGLRALIPVVKDMLSKKR